eukprot:TCONS_00021385-protein
MTVRSIVKISLTASVTLVTGSYLFEATNKVIAEENTEHIDSSASKTSNNFEINGKIAVIGTGIGGASATHFLRKLLGNEVQIDVFEKNDHLGGRMHAIDVNGEQIESGGTIIHSSNRYMVDFAKDLEMDTNIATDDAKLGIYNGKEFVFLQSSWKWLNVAKLIWRYGPFSLRNMDSALTRMLNDFVKIYDIQESEQAFRTVPEMLNALGGDHFVELTKNTSTQALKDEGVGDTLIQELITGISRCNYGQSTDDVNGFTGFVSLAGAQEGALWNVKDGNYKVPQSLIENSKANIRTNTKITSIKRYERDNKVKYELEGAPKNEFYDAIIVAAPLEVPSCFLDCTKCKNWPCKEELQKYQKTIATFIQMPLNHEYFGVKCKEDMADVVITTDSKENAFSTVAPQKTVKGVVTEPPVYKIFSREPLSDALVKKMFIVNSDNENKTSSDRTVVSWLAYPHYSPPEKFLPFELDEGVFYVNAIERAASAMEMSAIGGRNAALLAYHYLKGAPKK